MKTYFRKRLEGFSCLVMGPVLMLLAMHGFREGFSGSLDILGYQFDYAQPFGAGSVLMMFLMMLGVVITCSGIWILIRWSRR